MAADIGPGDWVEALITFDDGECRVVAGHAYRVTGMHEGEEPDDCAHCGPGCAHPVLDLAEFPPDPEYGWCASIFRPIYRPRADLIESLKTPAKRKEVPA